MHVSPEKQAAVQEQGLVRFGLGLANWSERWFPDPLIFALLGIVVTFVAGLSLHQSPVQLAIQGGKNFWTLVPFTMQMVMIIVGGYVVASTPIVYRAIRALAGIPQTPRGAVAMVALFSMLTSLISWGLSLIFSGLFVRELAHRVRGLDYRAAGGAGLIPAGRKSRAQADEQDEPTEKAQRAVGNVHRFASPASLWGGPQSGPANRRNRRRGFDGS